MMWWFDSNKTKQNKTPSSKFFANLGLNIEGRSLWGPLFSQPQSVMALGDSLCSSGQCRPALPPIPFFPSSASVPFSSSHLTPGLAHLKGSYPLIYAPGSVFGRTRVKEASVDSLVPACPSLAACPPVHDNLCIYTSGHGATCRKKL